MRARGAFVAPAPSNRQLMRVTVAFTAPRLQSWKTHRLQTRPGFHAKTPSFASGASKVMPGPKPLIVKSGDDETTHDREDERMTAPAPKIVRGSCGGSMVAAPMS